MAKQGPGKRLVIRNVTQTHQRYTLDDLPDEYRKLLPPEIIEQMRQGVVETPDVGALGKNDSAFDQNAFLERADTMIGAVREAEQNGQWDMVRPYMSARFLRRWLPWAQGLQALRLKRPGNLTRQLAIASVQSDAGFDRVTVRVAESSIPATQPPASTLWTFLRSAAGRGGQQTETLANVCTNCGAPVDTTNQQTCRYCGAGVAVLGPEWVLDDVTTDAAPSNVAA